MSIGRSRRADVSINDPSVSRIHAKLHVGEGLVRLEDLESSNGTFINGLRIADTEAARHGSTIALGDAEMTLSIEAMAFRTVKMSAVDLGAGGLPQVGEATSLLQAGSVDLAQQVLDQQAEDKTPEPGGPSFAAPPAEQPLSFEDPAPPPKPPPMAATPPSPPGPPPAAPPTAPSSSAPEVSYPPSFDDSALGGSAAERPAAPDPASLGEPLADPDQSQLLRTFDDIEADIDDPSAPAAAAAAPAAAPSPVASGLPAPAGFWIRLAAALIDGLWLSAVGFALSFGWSMVGGSETSLLPATLGGMIGLLVYVLGWGTVGTTPGKRLFGLYVCTLDGRPGIGIGRALLRYVGYCVSALLFFAGFLMIAFSSTKRGLHDLIAGSYVARRR